VEGDDSVGAAAVVEEGRQRIEAMAQVVALEVNHAMYVALRLVCSTERLVFRVQGLGFRV
jgi:hypothetical protein